MRRGITIIFTLTLTLIQCTKVDDKPWRTCLGKDITNKFELLDKSFYTSLKHNGLKDNEEFLKIVAFSGDSIFSKFLIPFDAKLTISDINDLKSVLWTKQDTYDPYNKLIVCLKKCNSCKTELVAGYINDKEAAGNISPTIVANGLLQTADYSELNDRLIMDLILLETYLPLLRKIGTK